MILNKHLLQVGLERQLPNRKKQFVHQKSVGLPLLKARSKAGDKLSKSKIIQDDAGEVKINQYETHFYGHHRMLATSLNGFQQLKQLSSPTAIEFHRFIPAFYRWSGQKSLQWHHQKTTQTPNRLFLLSGQRLTLKQLKWVLMRLFELAAWLAKEGYVHAGFTPESIWIIPKSKMIVVGSFYHLTTKGQVLTSVSEKYRDWYPEDALKTKIATSQIDIQMIKNLAVYLLGRKTGLGVNKVLRPLDPAWTDFLLAFHHNAYECLIDFQKLIKNQ